MKNAKQKAGIKMTPKQRVMTIRLLERIKELPAYAEQIGISGGLLSCCAPCGWQSEGTAMPMKLQETTFYKEA